MIYCGKPEFGQISRSFALNSGAILLKRPKNLTQIDFPSLRSVKPDRLLVCQLYYLGSGLGKLNQEIQNHSKQESAANHTFHSGEWTGFAYDAI